jgi:hypothetical protein
MFPSTPPTQRAVQASEPVRTAIDVEIASVESEIQKKCDALAVIRELDSKWSKAVRTEQIAYSKVVAKQLQHLYEQWIDGTNKLLARIKKAESSGRTVRGGEAFRDAVGFCPAGLDVDAVSAAFARLESGEGVPVTEAGHGKIRHRRAS